MAGSSTSLRGKTGWKTANRRAGSQSDPSGPVLLDLSTNQMRQVAEYLTYTDGDNITHPYLLENWQASDDLKTWTLNLRKGIKHNNGDTFNADDVIFTFNQWLDKDVGSSMKGMLSYLEPASIEKVSAHQVKLHLNNPK
jgi:peptide/nickel transport system substrate-binding protein